MWGVCDVSTLCDHCSGGLVRGDCMGESLCFARFDSSIVSVPGAYSPNGDVTIDGRLCCRGRNAHPVPPPPEFSQSSGRNRTTLRTPAADVKTLIPALL